MTYTKILGEELHMKLIRNFRHRSTIVSKGLDLLAMKEVEIARDKHANYGRGYYINFEGQMLGIVATPKGPLFFCNEDTYLLKDNFKIQLLHHGQENTFLFTWKGKPSCASHTPASCTEKETSGWMIWCRISLLGLPWPSNERNFTVSIL